MAKKTELEIEQELHEKQARINALYQLIENSQKDMMAGYEGLITQAEFDECKENRKLWFAELAVLEGDKPDPGEPMAVPILEQIENIEAGEFDPTALNELAKTTAALAAQVEELEKQIDELEPSEGSFPDSKYSPEEIIAAVEGWIDGLVGGA